MRKEKNNMPVQTSTRHTLKQRGGRKMGKSVLWLGEEHYGTKNIEETFYEALAPYFEELAELKIEQWGSEKE